MKRLAFLTLFIALAVGVSQALAGGGSATGSAPIQRHNEFCGFPISAPEMGTVTFTLVGDRLTVDFAIKNADPNTSYDATVWVTGGPFTCDRISKLGKIKTNAKGSAVAHFTTTASPEQCFFGSINAGGDFNDSTFVCLP